MEFVLLRTLGAIDNYSNDDIIFCGVVFMKYGIEKNGCDVLSVEKIRVQEIIDRISSEDGLAEELSLNECRNYCNVEALLKSGLTMIRVYLPSGKKIEDFFQKSKQRAS